MKEGHTLALAFQSSEVLQGPTGLADVKEFSLRSGLCDDGRGIR